MANNEKAKSMYEYYNNGLSLNEVGKIFGVTRQSVFSMFKARKFKLREKKTLSFIIVDSLKFTIRYDGYYYCTTNDTLSLHRHNWIKKNGQIPNGYELHHKDENKLNNDVSNLELLTTSEHTRLHSLLINGSHNNKKLKHIPSGKIFPSISAAEREFNFVKGTLQQKIKIGTVLNFEFI